MSTELTPGKYNIRFVPKGLTPPFDGGVYATYERIDHPIALEPQTPPYFERQTWIVERKDDGNFTIRADTIVVETPRDMVIGFGHRKEVVVSGEKVIFSPELKEWVIGSNDDGTYIISAPVPVIGAQFCIADVDSKLEIKSFAMSPVSLANRPRWEFIPA